MACSRSRGQEEQTLALGQPNNLHVRCHLCQGTTRIHGGGKTTHSTVPRLNPKVSVEDMLSSSTKSMPTYSLRSIQRLRPPLTLDNSYRHEPSPSATDTPTVSLPLGEKPREEQRGCEYGYRLARSDHRKKSRAKQLWKPSMP